MAIRAGLFVATLLLPLDAIAGQVTLAWEPSTSAVAGYVIYYGTSSGSYTASVDVGLQTWRAVQGLTDGRRYYFIVKSYSVYGVFSTPSNEVNGVAASFVFTDDPLVPTVHAMKAVHLTELRGRIDVLRSLRGLAPWPWTTLAVGTMIRASHITELRSVLNGEYVARGLAIPSYVDSSLTVGMPLKAVHVTQLRSLVMALQ